MIRRTTSISSDRLRKLRLQVVREYIFGSRELVNSTYGVHKPNKLTNSNVKTSPSFPTQKENINKYDANTLDVHDQS